MPLIRGHHSFDDHFTQIPNAWVRDARLSFKARGLLTLLMSHTPGWNMSVRSIARANGTGVDTIKTAVMELEEHGYLKRSKDQQRDENGTFADYVWVTADPFQNPVTDKTVHGKQDTKNTNLKEEQETKKYDQQVDRAFSEFWEVYPRKVGKEVCRKAFAKAYKTANGKVVLGAMRFANDPNLPPKQFVPHPATWLNRAGWEDEALPERTLSPEERKAKELADIAAKRIRDAEIAERERISRLAEEEALRKDREKNPIQHCEHGRNVFACPACSKNYV